MEEINDNQLMEETVEPTEVAEGATEEAINWQTKAEEAEKRIKELEFKAMKQRDKVKELKSKTVTEDEKKPNDFDYGQKAFLKSYGIDGADERELVKSFMSRTGDDLDTVIGDDILQAKLKSLRDAKVAKDAVPANTGRSATAQGNKLDYWLAKYQTSGNLSEVPKELQRDVLNAHLKADEQKTKFGG